MDSPKWAAWPKKSSTGPDNSIQRRNINSDYRPNCPMGSHQGIIRRRNAEKETKYASTAEVTQKEGFSDVSFHGPWITAKEILSNEYVKLLQCLSFSAQKIEEISRKTIFVSSNSSISVTKLNFDAVSKSIHLRVAATLIKRYSILESELSAQNASQAENRGLTDRVCPPAHRWLAGDKGQARPWHGQWDLLPESPGPASKSRNFRRPTWGSWILLPGYRK